MSAASGSIITQPTLDRKGVSWWMAVQNIFRPR